MANGEALGLELTSQIGRMTITLDMSWFIAVVDDDCGLIAVLYPSVKGFYPPEQMLRAMGEGDRPIISLLSSCEVTEPEIEPPPPPGYG